MLSIIANCLREFVLSGYSSQDLQYRTTCLVQLNFLHFISSKNCLLNFDKRFRTAPKSMKTVIRFSFVAVTLARPPHASKNGRSKEKRKDQASDT